MNNGQWQLSGDGAVAKQRPGTSLWLRAVFVIWLLLAASGMAWLAQYESAPGASAQPPASWPAQSRIPRHKSGSTLVMFAHPHCPCTRASIRELSLVMARCQSSVRAVVLFTQPAGFDRGWVESDLWRHAAAIPGVSVMADREGSEARGWGVETSGQVLLYDNSGALRFRGGITPSRGHSGDNLGRSAILAEVAVAVGGKPAPRECFVFGCPLFSANGEPDLPASDSMSASDSTSKFERHTFRSPLPEREVTENLDGLSDRKKRP